LGRVSVRISISGLSRIYLRNSLVISFGQNGNHAIKAAYVFFSPEHFVSPKDALTEETKFFVVIEES
jgi:hypothetical protein